MNQFTVPLQHHLLTLQQLYPVTGLVHAGAGLAAAHAWYVDWPIPQMHWIEADAMRYQLLQQQAAFNQEVHHALLGDQDSPEVTWHQFSSPNESGLLPASSLIALWPNVQSMGQLTQAQTTLDTLLAAKAGINWLYIDCLPAARILSGATQVLKHADVVVARVTTNQIETMAGQGASLQELFDSLQPLGFNLLAQEEECNPAYCTAVWVRDYVSLHAKATQEIELQMQVRHCRNNCIKHKLNRRNYLKKLELQAQNQRALEANLAQAQKTVQTETEAKLALQYQLRQAMERLKLQEVPQAQLQQMMEAEAGVRKDLEQTWQAHADLLKKLELQAQVQQGTHRLKC